MRQVILEAHADLALGMRGNSEPGLALDILLAQIYILLRARVHNINVDALAVAWADDGSDDDEGVVVCGVPNTLLGRETVGLEDKFYGMRWAAECAEDGEEEQQRGWAVPWS